MQHILYLPHHITVICTLKIAGTRTTYIFAFSLYFTATVCFYRRLVGDSMRCLSSMFTTSSKFPWPFTLSQGYISSKTVWVFYNLNTERRSSNSQEHVVKNMRMDVSIPPLLEFTYMFQRSLGIWILLQASNQESVIRSTVFCHVEP